MMWLFATLTSTFVFGIGSFLLKVGSHKKYAEASMLLGLYLVGSAILLGALLVHRGITFNWSVFGYSLIVGFGSYYGNSFLVKAYDLGPASLTSPLMNISVLLVIVLSAFIYNENLTEWQYTGITCMIIATSLLSYNFNSQAIKSKMWIVFVCLAIIFLFMREGGLKIAYEVGLDNIGILFFGYALATLLSTANFIRIRPDNAHHRHAFFLGSLVGIFSAIGMGLLAYAMTRGPAAIIVPIFSARNIITVLLIVFFFKEKLHRLQWIAVLLMMIGIAFIS